MSTRIEREGGGYFTCPNRWFDAGYAKQVPATITSVYMFLCRWEGKHMENESSQPIPTIAKQVGCSPDVARDAVRVLEEWDVLHRTPARGPKGENVWLLKALQEIAPETPYQPTKGRKTTPHKKNQGSEKNHGEKNQAYQPDVNQPISSDKSSDTSGSDSDESSPGVANHEVASDQSQAGGKSKSAGTRVVPYDLFSALVEANGLGEQHEAEKKNRGLNLGLAKTMVAAGVTPNEVRAQTRHFRKGEENMDSPPPNPMTLQYLWGKDGSVYKSWVERGRPGMVDVEHAAPIDREEFDRAAEVAKKRGDEIMRSQVEKMARALRGEE